MAEWLNAVSVRDKLDFIIEFEGSNPDAPIPIELNYNEMLCIML